MQAYTVEEAQRIAMNCAKQYDKNLNNQKYIIMLRRSISSWRKRNTPPLLVGVQACTTTLEISLAVPQKIGHSTTRGSRNTSPGHISRRCSNR